MAEIRVKPITLVIGSVCLVGALLLALLAGAALSFLVFRGQLMQSKVQVAQLEEELARLREQSALPTRLSRQVNPGTPPRLERMTLPAPPGFDSVVRPPASVNKGDIININFAGEGKQGRAAIGRGDADLWNRYHFPFAMQTNLEDLKTIEGRSTGALFQTHTLTGEWGWKCDDPMWGSFAYSETDEGSLRFPNLPPGAYTLYIFAHGAGEPNPSKDWDCISTTRVDVSGKDYGILSTEPSPEFLSLEWKKGIHYVVFENLEVGTGSMLNITLLRGGRNAKPCINGLQLQRIL